MKKDYDAYEARVGVVRVPDDYDALDTLKSNTMAKLTAQYVPWLVLLVALLLSVLGAAAVYIRRKNVRRM